MVKITAPKWTSNKVPTEWLPAYETYIRKVEWQVAVVAALLLLARQELREQATIDQMTGD